MSSSGEQEFWTGSGGLVWVRRQSDLDLLSASVGRLLLDEARLGVGLSVLDVGCGAGASTLAAAEAVGPDGHVTGVDISAPLLDLARTRARGIPNVSFVEGDAQVDRAPRAPFGAMISRFGTMFFADPVVAFANIAAQLEPGAPLTFAAWAAAAENPWFAIPHRLAEERLGPAPPTDPDAPGPTAFRDVGRVTSLLRRAGLRDVDAQACDVDLHHPGGPSALADLAMAVGPAARLLRLHDAAEAQRDALRHDVEAALAAFATADGIRIPARILVYRARSA